MRFWKNAPVDDEQVRANLETMHVEFLAREIMLRNTPGSEYRDARSPREVAQALFNLGWRPPGYCQCGVTAIGPASHDSSTTTTGEQ